MMIDSVNIHNFKEVSKIPSVEITKTSMNIVLNVDYFDLFMISIRINEKFDIRISDDENDRTHRRSRHA